MKNKDKKYDNNKFSYEGPTLETWIYWLAATVVAGVMMTAFVYTNFQTKSEASESKVDLDRRLERMEAKIDQLLSGRSNSK